MRRWTDSGAAPAPGAVKSLTDSSPETGAGAAPLSDVCGVVPDARNPLGERYTDVPARGPVSADAAAATTAVGPASARRSAARSDVTSGVAGAWYGCRFRDRGLSTAYTLD